MSSEPPPTMSRPHSKNPQTPNYEDKLVLAFVRANEAALTVRGKRHWSPKSRFNEAKSKLIGTPTANKAPPHVQELELHFLAGCIGLHPGRIIPRSAAEARRGFPNAPVLQWHGKHLHHGNISWYSGDDLSKPGALVECLRRAAEFLGHQDPKNTAINASHRFKRYRPYLVQVADGSIAEFEIHCFNTINYLHPWFSDGVVRVSADPIDLQLASLWGVADP